MKYQPLNREFIAEQHDRDDSLLHIGLVLPIAESELTDSRKWVAQLKSTGEVYGKLREDGEIITITDNNFDTFFDNDVDINRASENGALEIEYTNWFDLEFVVDGKHMEMSDQAVAFSLSEGIELFENYIKMSEREFTEGLKRK